MLSARSPLPSRSLACLFPPLPFFFPFIKVVFPGLFWRGGHGAQKRAEEKKKTFPAASDRFAGLRRPRNGARSGQIAAAAPRLRPLRLGERGRWHGAAGCRHPQRPWPSCWGTPSVEGPCDGPSAMAVGRG